MQYQPRVYKLFIIYTPLYQQNIAFDVDTLAGAGADKKGCFTDDACAPTKSRYTVSKKSQHINRATQGCWAEFRVAPAGAVESEESVTKTKH